MYGGVKKRRPRPAAEEVPRAATVARTKPWSDLEPFGQATGEGALHALPSLGCHNRRQLAVSKQIIDVPVSALAAAEVMLQTPEKLLKPYNFFCEKTSLLRIKPPGMTFSLKRGPAGE